MSGKASVTVLMSTYNGQKYLAEQIDSILNQKDVVVNLIIRDDGSKDDTLHILESYQGKYDNINIISDNVNLGPCRSFLKLIRENYDSEYFALSDQDDVWETDKLISAVSKIKQYNKDIPLLYFSNLKVVDSELTYHKLFYDKFPSIKNRYSCLIETYATGCTVVYNRRLAETAARLQPQDFSMHDAWLFDIASLLGRTIYDESAHICYRQHQSNVIGEQINKNLGKTISNRWHRIFNNKLHPYSENAKVLYSELKKDLKKEDLILLDDLANYRFSFAKKIRVLFDSTLKTKDFDRNIRFKIFQCKYYSYCLLFFIFV